MAYHHHWFGSGDGRELNPLDWVFVGVGFGLVQFLVELAMAVYRKRNGYKAPPRLWRRATSLVHLQRVQVGRKMVQEE